jgi:hypothetical protein
MLLLFNLSNSVVTAPQMNSTSSILESFLNYIILLNTPFDFDEINRLSSEMPDVPAWVWCSFVLEVVIIVIGGIWTVLCQIILYKHPLFHKNLQVLIGGFALTIHILRYPIN